MNWYSSKRATTVIPDGEGFQACIYHQTKVVRWNLSTGEVALDAGGHQSYTTKKRMNEVSEHYGLGFLVFQKDHQWYVRLPNGCVSVFGNNMSFNFKRDGVGWSFPTYTA